MNHSFVTQSSSPLCRTCNRKLSDHLSTAICEACGNKGACSVIDNLLLCDAKCFPAREQSLREQLNSTDNIKQSVFDIARQTDLGLRHYTDMFNAEITGLGEVRQEIEGDETLSEAEKHYKLTNFIADRIVTYKQLIFDADKVKFDNTQKVNGALEFLRQHAIELNKELKAKLVESDKTYTPIVNKVKPLGVRKSPQEKVQENLVNTWAAVNNISIESAVAELKTKGKLPDFYKYTGKV